MHICKLITIGLVVLLTLGDFTLLSRSQQDSTISGRILDKNSGLPVPDVNVFLANTTIGAASDHQGEFEINNVPQGIYDLIFDCIGYEIKLIKVSLLQQQSFTFFITLEPKIYSAEKIQVLAEIPKEWLKNLELFSREFIGRSTNANECVILNPEVLELLRDAETDNLVAFTDSILRIRNDALGYHIDVKLVQFEYNLKNNFCRYEIYPRYIELIPSDKKQLSRWIDNRQKAFQGSLKHFLFLLNQNEYFPVFKLYILTGNRGIVHVTKEILHCEPVLNSSLIRISFTNFVGLEYFSFSIPQKSSMIRLDQGYAYIDSLGNIFGPITKKGKWSEERLADLLPYDYKPDK